MTCILCMDFAMAMHVLLFKNTKDVFPIEGFRLEVYLSKFMRNTLPKSGTFLLGHPVYIYIYIYIYVCVCVCE